MPEPELDLDFSFYARGLELGSLEVLETPLKAIGVKSFDTYSGQLDDEKKLADAISQKTLRYPFVLASYAGGASENDPPTSETDLEPRYHRHYCQFSLIVADDNPQGETQRRNKVYDMASVIWKTLVGVRLKKQVGDEQILLNSVPFDEPGHVMIGLPNATGMGIIFNIAFDWVSPDRTDAGQELSEIIVGVTPRGDPTGNPGNLPGVEVRT